MPMQGELPHSPTQRQQRRHHHPYSHPSQSRRGLVANPVPPHIFCKLYPVVPVRADGAALPQAGFKPLKPRGLIQSKRCQITSDNAFPEHSARQLAVLACLESMQMPRRNLRLLADSLNRDLTPLSFPSQLVAESFHSLRSAIVSHRPRSLDHDLVCSKDNLASRSSQRAFRSRSLYNQPPARPLLHAC
jgi:hypothetical protein